jgi:phosphate transport system permease protein
MAPDKLNFAVRPSRIWQDRIFFLAVWAVGSLGALLPLGIVGFLFYRGGQALTWQLLWHGPRGFPLGSGGGIRPAIEGSLALILLGLMAALPLGVGAAIYLSEYNPGQRVRRAATFCSACFAGVPAIVYGLFGYALLVVGLRMKVSLLAGGITLGLVMLPVVLLGAYEAIRGVESKYRETALALGVSRFYAFRRNILPKAFAGILAAVVLAAAHAFGSAAPVLFTASVVLFNGEFALFSPVMTLPTHLYYLVSEASSADQAYATALILVTLVMVGNLAVAAIKNRQERCGVP